MRDFDKQDLDVQSPCIGVCAMDETTGFCHGCYRSIIEIQDWWDMDIEQKKSVIKKANLRAEAVFDN